MGFWKKKNEGEQEEEFNAYTAIDNMSNTQLLRLIAKLVYVEFGTDHDVKEEMEEPKNGNME